MKTIGVIGLGSIGMRHAKNLLAMGHTVWGHDPDNSRLSLFNQLVGKPLAQPWGAERKLDGVIIATPTGQHHADLENLGWIKEPLIHAASTPLFIEKPIADKIVEIPPNLAMVGNNLRFHSCVKKAKEWMAEGLIGKPLWASFTVAQHNTKYTDPVVLNWGAHEIDLALYLLGPATVTAAAGDDKIMDVCLLHEYGVPSTIHCDYVTTPERRVFTIAGWDGTIECDLVLRTIECTPSPKMGGMVNFHVMEDSFDENYKDEMQAFIDLIDGKPVPHAATGQDGLACLELILEAKQMAGIS